MTETTQSTESIQSPIDLFEWALRLGVPIFALSLALFAMNPEVVGSFQDDALYLDMARSLGQGQGFQSEVLPGQVQLGKYPVLYPLLLSIFFRLGNPSPTLLLIFQSLLFSATISVIVNGFMPCFGFKKIERFALCLLLMTHEIVLQSFVSLLSEPLFTLLLTLHLGWLASQLHKPDPSPKKLILGASLSLLACLTRTIHFILVPISVLLLLRQGQRKSAAVLSLTLVFAFLTQSTLRTQLAADNQEKRPKISRALHYYLDYKYHTSYYSDPLKAGELNVFAARLSRIGRVNSQQGVQSLGKFLDPIRPTELALGLSPGRRPALHGILGLLLLGLAFYGLYQDPRLRPLIALLIPYIAFFTVWTWVFSGRFWLPILPFLLMGLLITLRRVSQRHVAIPIALLILLLSLPYTVLALQSKAVPDYSKRDPKTLNKAERHYLAFESHIDWLSKASEKIRGDVFVGGFNSFWLGQRLRLPALWLDTLQDRDAFLEQNMKLGQGPQTKLDQSEHAWQRLLIIRRAMSPKAKLFLQVDFTSSPVQMALTRSWASQGRIQVLQSNPFLILYQVPAPR
jgi:hypothetical protein